MEWNQNPAFEDLLSSGSMLESAVLKFLEDWPRDEKGTPLRFEDTNQEFRNIHGTLRVMVQKWLNSVYTRTQFVILHDRSFFKQIFDRLDITLEKKEFIPLEQPYPIEIAVEKAQSNAVNALTEVRDAIRAVPFFPIQQPQQQQNVIPNLAFVLMRISREYAELEDVLNTIKEICSRFGIVAFRADDLQHAERITDVTLASIRGSEFLIADLTGERPNVYYEIGFAHALGKRPILIRKAGTNIHFDLSVHNVLDYRNMTELKDVLSRRFEAITGRAPQNASAPELPDFTPPPSGGGSEKA